MVSTTLGMALVGSLFAFRLLMAKLEADRRFGPRPHF
jgi:hypothetical protein